jgi:hypothetical protein
MASEVTRHDEYHVHPQVKSTSAKAADPMFPELPQSKFIESTGKTIV